MRLLEPLFYGFCLLSGVCLLAHTFSAQYAAPRFVESMLYPRVILIAWILFAAIAQVQALLKKRTVQRGQNKRVVLATAAMLFLCLAMIPLGFIPTAFIFFCLYAVVLGFSQMTTTVLSSAGTTLTLWFLFEKVLEVSLPAGLFFR